MLFLKRKKYNSFSDIELIHQSQKSDGVKAIEELFNRYALMVKGICLKYLQNKENAEDMTLLIFIQLKEKLKNHEVKNFKSWLYTLTRNECLMLLRKNKIPTSSIDHHQHFHNSTDNENEEIDIIEAKEEKYTKLEEAIQELKENQKICIELFYFQKKCYDEIASITNLSVKQVKSHLQNGKRNIKLKMQKNGV